MIRGMVVATVAVSGCFGSIIYLQIERITTASGKIYMTFGSILLIDTATLLILLPFIYFNVYGSNEGGHG